jgi:acetoin utilization deacetylase AcuC-like enzyme
MQPQAQENSNHGLGYLLDNRCCAHDTGKLHPESPQRLIALQQMLATNGLAERWGKIDPRLAGIGELELIHAPGYIERIERAAKRAPFYLDMDTPVSSESYKTARLAVGGVLQCIDALCSGKLRRIFAFIRPPGHHADYETASGFCLFNNAAIAAAYARKTHKLKRIAIVDIDVHHGNGTQSTFYDDPHVLYISSHQFPFYPGSGDFDEVGTGKGKGYTLNFPLPEGTGDAVFIPIYSKIVANVLNQFSPQLILVSAGFDGHFRDPLGGLALTHAGYASAAASLLKAADRECEGKICFVLEGGYNLQALQECAHATLVEMEKKNPVELPVREGSLFREISRQAAKFSRGLWKW